MNGSKIYHLNDRTMKYLTLAQTKRQHEYLGLPGNFKYRYPQEMTYPNLASRKADELYITDEGLIIDLEEESGPISRKTLQKFAEYLIHTGYRYGNNLYLAVICHKNPKKEYECYKVSPSLYIRIHYYHFSQEELWEKYENIINKIRQKEKLTDMEALDIAFVSKFISPESAPDIIESLTYVFDDALIEDHVLKLDISVILAGMILKHIDNIKRQNRLLRRINMRQIENEIERLVYDEYGDELDKKDKLIEEQEQEITKLKNNEKIYKNNEKIYKNNEKIYKNNEKEYKNKIKQLNSLKNLPPEARKIISQ